MTASPDLYWLPKPPPDWRRRLAALAETGPGWREACALADFALPFPATNALDAAALRIRQAWPEGTAPARQKLAVLSTSTSAHLCPGLRVGALRRGMALDIYEPAYGQYLQDVADPSSGLYAFAPTHVLLAFDAVTVAAHVRAAASRDDAAQRVAAFLDHLRGLWDALIRRTGATIIQQTVMPRLPASGGGNDHRFPASGAAFVAEVNHRLRERAETAGVDLLALDSRVAQDGVDRWFSPSSWHGAKQEVALPASPMYGDLLARLIASRDGRAAKCCVFDLDNTLWGGVIGDDGLSGIVVGTGSAAGEAFLALQHYALDLRRRGVLLAVCSKNTEAVALDVFDRHPEMALKRADIACFVANWQDKPTNLRAIARHLNVGLDALVFVDDNVFERELVRAALPEVSVPEVPDDPALVPRCLADAGYFELTSLTEEDGRRAALYAENARRDRLRSEATDLEGYLAGLDMVLHCSRFTEAELPRVTQLINKTNQFNLTTRRLNASEVRRSMMDPRGAGLQFRLLDRFGDNGVIAVVIGHVAEDATFVIDDWLMSCRVLGRQVEDATLNAVVSAARGLGAVRLRGAYRPTGRNGMVADLLARLGFATEGTPDTAITGVLDLASFIDRKTAMRMETMAP